MLNACFFGFLPILIILGFREASKILAHNIVMSLAGNKAVLFGFDFGTLKSFEDVTAFLQSNSIYVTALCNVICIIIFAVMYRKDIVETGDGSLSPSAKENRQSQSIPDGDREPSPVSPASVIRAVVASLAIAIAVSNLIHLAGLDAISAGYRAYQAGYSSQELVVLLVATGFLAPLAEELCFRGLMYRRIKLFVGERAAMVISALCFGVIHGNIPQFVYASILGIFLAYFYECTGSILVPLLSHMAVNILATFMTSHGIMDWMYTNNMILLGATLIYASIALMMMKGIIKEKKK